MSAPNWPGPPFLEHWTLDNPWPLVVQLLALAVVLMTFGLQRNSRKLKGWALTLGLIGLLLPVVAWRVVTDREGIRTATHRLVQNAQDPIHLEAIRDLLDPQMRFFELDQPGFLQAMERALKRDYRMISYTFTRLEAHLEGPDAGATYMALWTNLETREWKGGVKSTWILHWKRSPDGVWRLTELEWLTLNEQPARRGDLP